MRVLYTPREHQTEIRNHIAYNQRCGVFAGMGTGKTVSTLTAIDELFLLGEERRPALVCAPLRVAQSTWPDEAKKWQHLREIEVSPIIGNPDERRRALRRDASVYTINYENIPWLMEELNGKFPFGTVIADEATRLKGFRLNQGTARAKALGRIAHVHPSRWINLTGTPAPNGLKDLWGQTWFLDQGQRLGRTFGAFEDRWFRLKRDGFGLEPLPFAQEQIEEKLKDLCLSITPPWAPEPIRHPVMVDLPRKARQLYDDMERRLFLEIEGWEVEAFNSASKTLKLLQLAAGAIYVDKETKEWKEVHDEKLQALESIVEEAAGMPVLVSYHFRSDLVRLQRAFPRGRVLDTKPSTIRDWNSGQIPIMFAHPQSAGHGLNLQDGGNIIVHFSHTWDLELYQQINERIGPMRQMQAGYNRPVFQYDIIARDTMDEDVIARRINKASVQDALMTALRKRGRI